MKTRHPVTIFSLMMLIVLFGFGCSSVQQTNSEKSKTPINVNAKTKITKDNLKARLSEMKARSSETKVRFIEDNPDEIRVVDISMPKLKIVSAETPPKVDLNGEVYEFSQVLTKLSYIFQRRNNKSVTLAASESDIAFYNKEGISVEDFELLIRNLEGEVNEFNVDFTGIQIPDEISPKSKTTAFPSPKLELPKDDEPPPPRKSTPK